MGFTPYTLEQNQFLTSVLNKIGRQVWSSKAYTNPLKEFKKGFIENANDIEEIYIARLEGTAQDFEGTNPLTRVKPNITTMYHRQNYSKLYQATVSDVQARRAFTTSGGVKKLADGILESLYTGDQYEEYVAMRDNFGALADKTPTTGKIKIASPTDNATSKAYVKQIKKIVGEMKFRNTKYSTVESHATAEELMFVTTPSLMAELDVELLATAFNTDKLKMIDKIVEVDILPTGVSSIILDKNALMVFDTLHHIEPMRNGKGMFTNYFLNVEKIISYSNMYQVAQISNPTA